MAFPALGLAKIVWAADVILAMDLPEFHIENLDSPAGWHDLLAANDAKNDEITYVDCKGRSLFIYRKGTDYACTTVVAASGHQTFRTCARGQAAHLSEASVGVRCDHRPVCGEGQPPAARVQGQARGGRLLAFW